MEKKKLLEEIIKLYRVGIINPSDLQNQETIRSWSDRVCAEIDSCFSEEQVRVCAEIDSSQVIGCDFAEEPERSVEFSQEELDDYAVYTHAHLNPRNINEFRCRYFTGSKFLKCAVNPSGNCSECPHYEEDKLD